ncbi:methyltransferase, type 11 [Seminavis robusta]|uniref:Methyltransferase, type 11 n=1 Tax=Seminavis robusta TaxID=568900 RepID=A0A9N8HQM5_9STRA|nr:methyltransferase, type 11 [Seminavis robusta]|eukprot:Sro999_g229610.1 methyltransferase, type 11 (233) ;mRNA; f:8523-9221
MTTKYQAVSIAPPLHVLLVICLSLLLPLATTFYRRGGRFAALDILLDKAIGRKRDYFLDSKYYRIKDYYGFQCLDVGSGNGDYSKFLKEQGRDVSSVDVLDLSHTGTVTLFDGTNIPFGDNQFDTSLLMFVLHHSTDQKGLLKDVMRVTRDYIIVAEDLIVNPFDAMLGQIHLHSSPWAQGEHEDAFKTHSQWQTFFAELKLQVVDTVTISRWTYPVYPVVRNIYVLKVPST